MHTEKINPRVLAALRRWGRKGGLSGDRKKKSESQKLSWAPGGKNRQQWEAKRIKAYGCICGRTNQLPQEVLDNYKERFLLTCECGRVHRFFQGKVTLAKVRRND